MSSLMNFFRNNRVLCVMLPIFTGEFYVWWKLQQDERFVPQDQKSELFVKPLEYAQKLYVGTSHSNTSNNDKK